MGIHFCDSCKFHFIGPYWSFGDFIVCEVCLEIYHCIYCSGFHLPEDSKCWPGTEDFRGTMGY